MKKIFLFILFLFLSLPTLTYSKTQIDKAFVKRTKNIGTEFTIYSPDLFNGRKILENQVYNGFGCTGKNISPKLVWKNEPNGTKSFAITIFDKDAETDSGWWHWILYDIPLDVHVIQAGASTEKKLLPKGSVQGLNDYGERKFGGVCQTNGKNHNYVVTLYALNVEKLDLPKNASSAMISYFLNKHKISTVEIRPFYVQKIDSEDQEKMNKVFDKEDDSIKYKLNGSKQKTKGNSKKSNKNVIIED